MGRWKLQFQVVSEMKGMPIKLLENRNRNWVNSIILSEICSVDETFPCNFFSKSKSKTIIMIIIWIFYRTQGVICSSMYWIRKEYQSNKNTFRLSVYSFAFSFKIKSHFLRVRTFQTLELLKVATRKKSPMKIMVYKNILSIPLIKQ